MEHINHIQKESLNTYVRFTRITILLPQDFKEHTAYGPYVHFIAIVPISKKALGGAIPPRTDVLRVWVFRVHTTA